MLSRYRSKKTVIDSKFFFKIRSDDCVMCVSWKFHSRSGNVVNYMTNICYLAEILMNACFFLENNESWLIFKHFHVKTQDSNFFRLVSQPLNACQKNNFITDRRPNKYRCISKDFNARNGFQISPSSKCATLNWKPLDDFIIKIFYEFNQ